MNKDKVSAILLEKLSQKGIHLSKAEGVIIGKAVRYPMWRWHVWSGYVLIGLYMFRMLIFRLQGVPFKNPFKKHLDKKERFKSVIYVLFYICLTTSLLTGIILVWFPREWDTLHHLAQDIHIKALYYAISFIVLHLGGLVLGELGKDKGIISRMIHGKT